MRRLAALAGAFLAAALILSACGRQQPPGAGRPGTTPAAATGKPAATVKLAAQKPAAPGTESSTITRVNEDGSETVEDTSADSGSHNLLLAAVASTANAASLEGPSLWQEGVNYTRLVPAQPTAVPAGQVEVLEFFWYACPHCYALDPLIENWKKTKPAYISFSRVPVMWSEGHRSLARMFYTLDSMGKLNDVHTAIFKEIHVNGNPLVDLNNNDARSEQIQSAFMAKINVSPELFQKTYRSFAVETDLQRADQLTQRYRVTGVPSFVINGKYIADVGTAGSEERLIALVNDLAAAEHKH
jgi:thiol:disulfide interchange protein DsbA